jgi:hypothetical protein
VTDDADVVSRYVLTATGRSIRSLSLGDFNLRMCGRVSIELGNRQLKMFVRNTGAIRRQRGERVCASSTAPADTPLRPELFVGLASGTAPITSS